MIRKVLLLAGARGCTVVHAQFNRRTQAEDFEGLPCELVPDGQRAREATGRVSCTVQLGGGVS
jgi:hypothetical protein